MIKKIILACSLVIIMMFTTSCNINNENNTTIDDIIASSMADTQSGQSQMGLGSSISSSSDTNSETSFSQKDDESENSSSTSDVGHIVDLTELSSTMLFAEVINMYTNPDDYLGKTVKVTGMFAKFESDDTGKMYFAVVVVDNTACCSQSIEFTLPDGAVYPDDYPEEGSDITIMGTFSSYYEDDMLYCNLTNTKIIE